MLFGRLFGYNQCPMRPMPMQQNNACGMANFSKNESVMEPVQTNEVVKDHYVNVEHIQPVHTHVVNKVHYKHTYVPKYSCSESTEILDNGCGKCNNSCNSLF